MLSISTLPIGFLTDQPSIRDLHLQPSFGEVGMADSSDNRLFQILIQGKSVSVALKAFRKILDLLSQKSLTVLQGSTTGHET